MLHSGLKKTWFNLNIFGGFEQITISKIQILLSWVALNLYQQLSSEFHCMNKTD